MYKEIQEQEMNIVSTFVLFFFYNFFGFVAAVVGNLTGKFSGITFLFH